jgi:hypothetical protein
VSDSTAPRRRPSQRVTSKPTVGTPAVDGGAQDEPGPVNVSADLLRDLSDLVAVLRREPIEPGSVAHRLVEQAVAGMVVALAIHAEPHVDVTAVRLTPFLFAGRDLDVTVAGEKDAEALLGYIKAHGGSSVPTYGKQVLPRFHPEQVHHQWELTWRGLNVRIGTVIHPDDAAAKPHAARLSTPETASPAATADEVSTDPDPTAVEEA